MVGNLNRYFSSRSSVNFWYLPVKYDQSVDYKNSYFYYLDFSEKVKYKGPFDAKGIPLLDYKNDIGTRYNPAAIAQYGLGALYDFGKTKNKDSFNKLILVAEWLIDNLRISSEKDGLYLWLYDFDLDTYALKAPWASALAQGQGISLLVRAYKILQDEKFASKALEAFNAFLVKVEQGGIRREIDKGVVFEEAPTKKLSCILDGFIFSLFGLMDLHIFYNHKKALQEFDIAINTLEKILPQYDMKFWSRGDLYIDWPKMIASPFYHRLHIYQLDTLYRLTQKDIFKYYSQKWNKELNNKLFKFLAIIYKGFFKILYY